MASLGELFVTVGANVAGFKQAMSDVQSGAQDASDKINKQLLGAVTALTGAAVAAGLAFDDAIDKIRIDTGADGAQLDALAQSFKNVYAALPSDSTAVATAIADINTRLGLMGTE
jgi:Sec-independent protein translocase protein TatA